VRVDARKQKGAQNKVALVMEWIKSHKNNLNKSRVKNWLEMSRMGFKDQESKVYYTIALEQLEEMEFEKVMYEEEDNDLTKHSDEDLLKVYKDIKKRKWSFQYNGAPISHVRFINKMEDELSDRGLY
jgi:hypothetical protein